jgi:hypothetical protein
MAERKLNIKHNGGTLTYARRNKRIDDNFEELRVLLYQLYEHAEYLQKTRKQAILLERTRLAIASFKKLRKQIKSVQKIYIRPRKAPAHMRDRKAENAALRRLLGVRTMGANLNMMRNREVTRTYAVEAFEQLFAAERAEAKPPQGGEK